MYTARQVADMLGLSLPTVYRHKRALGGFQIAPGTAVIFPENRIEQIRNGEYALPDEKREMAGKKNDRGCGKNTSFSNKNRSKEVGSRSKSRVMGSSHADPYHLLD